ncbi:glycosyltransferase [Cupriavidus basilensis]
MARRADVIYAYHPPLTVGISASLIRLFRRIPVVYDVQDMWPDTLRATGMVRNTRVLDVVSRVCDWVYRRVDHIVVLSPGFKDLLVQRGVPAAKIDVIYNWADEAALAAPTGRLPDDFPGGRGSASSLPATWVKRRRLTRCWMPQRCYRRRSRVCFVMLGGGVEVDRLKARAAELRIGECRLLAPGADGRGGNRAERGGRFTRTSSQGSTVPDNYSLEDAGVHDCGETVS